MNGILDQYYQHNMSFASMCTDSMINNHLKCEGTLLGYLEGCCGINTLYLKTKIVEKIT
jgi:hypothetical protein